jgi:hypothetical protein
MSADRWHWGLLEAAARELDRNLRAMSWEETYRAEYLRDHSAQLDMLADVIDVGVEVRGRFTWAKLLIKRALRPYLFRQARVDRLMFERLVDLTEAVRQTASALEGLRADVRVDLDYQEQRLRKANRPNGRRDDGGAAVAPASHLHLADADDASTIPIGARLLLGDTPVSRPGYLRIDPYGAGTDVLARLDAIPAARGSISEIVAANVLESYSTAEVRHTLLPHWTALLRP